MMNALAGHMRRPAIVLATVAAFLVALLAAPALAYGLLGVLSA